MNLLTHLAHSIYPTKVRRPQSRADRPPGGLLIVFRGLPLKYTTPPPHLNIYYLALVDGWLRRRRCARASWCQKSLRPLVCGPRSTPSTRGLIGVVTSESCPANRADGRYVRWTLRPRTKRRSRLLRVPGRSQRTVPYQTRLELFVRGILTEYNTIHLGNIIYLGSQKEWLTGLRGLKRYTAFRGGLSRAPRPRPPRARPYHPLRTKRTIALCQLRFGVGKKCHQLLD